MVEEKLSIEDKSRIIKLFNKRLCNKSKLIACGSCGERKYNSLYHEVNLELHLELLKLNSNRIEERNHLGEYKGISSVHKINGQLYHIHPECISQKNDEHHTNLSLRYVIITKTGLRRCTFITTS